MPKVVDLSVTTVTTAALRAILEYRYLTVNQVAVMVGIKSKSASAMLLRLERHKLLGWFGNTGIRGMGKTPKVYYLTRSGHRLLAAELAAGGEDIGPFSQVKINTRWSPLMYHRIATLDVLSFIERDCRKLQAYRLMSTLVEYRREKIGRHWRKETTDYVTTPLTPENKIVPDAGFAIEHRASGKRVLFLIEVDLGTTTLVSDRPQVSVKSFTDKLAQYDQYLASRRVKDRFARLGRFSGFHVLVITNSDARVANMRTAAASLSASFHPYYRFSTIDTVRHKFLHDGWLSRDHADLKTYHLIKGS